MSQDTPPGRDAPPGRGRPSVGMRAAHARRVGAEHVGQRVSVRRLVDDPDRGPVPADVVGRLLAHDDEVLLIVDRRGQLHVVDAARVVASRVVPPHPRLPAEPEVGTREHPLEREAARALVLDDARVLLCAMHPAPGQRVWTAPGGGCRPDEPHEEAVRRELREEVGLEIDAPGPWVWRREVELAFRGVWLRQRERWFLVTAGADAEAAPLDDPGLAEARWWSLDELRATDETLAPARLVEHLERLLAEGPPSEPVDVGR